MADNKKLINVEGLSKVASGIKGYVDKKDQAMDTRMQAVEGAKHTHDNAEELAKVVDGKVAAWDAKAEVSDVQAAQQAAEGKAAELVQGLQEGAVAQNAADLRSAEGRLTTLEGLVVGGEGEGIKAILADVEALKTAVGDDKAGLVAEMDAAEGRLDALDGESGRMAVAEGAIDALKGRMTTVEAFETRIAANEDAIEVLNGEGDGSVKKAVADGIAAVVADANADFDTLKEVADWIMTDGTNAAGLQTQVAANKTALEVLNGTGVGSVTKAVGDEAALRVAGDQAVEGKVTAEATARQQADEALGGRIDGVIERVAAVEGRSHHEHANKDVLEGISADKVAAWDGKAEVSAVEGVQGEVDALEGRVAAVEGRSHHEHTNKDVLDGISADKVAAWDGKAEVSAVQTAQAAAEAAQGTANQAVQDAAAASGKVDTLRTDMVAVFNALDLKYEDNKVKLVLPANQSGVETPLGEAELPILTVDEAADLLVELGLVEEE